MNGHGTGDPGLDELLSDLVDDDEPEPDATKATKEPKLGFIYFIRRTNSMRWVKIGWTGNLKDRLKTLQTASPEMLFIHAFEPDKTKGDERAIHNLFKGCRRSGEWFYVKGPVLDYLHDRYGWALNTGSKAYSPRHYERLAKKEEEAKAAELAELVRLTAEAEKKSS